MAHHAPDQIGRSRDPILETPLDAPGVDLEGVTDVFGFLYDGLTKPLGEQMRGVPGYNTPDEV